MRHATKILSVYPYATLFVAVLAEQIGLPVPSVVVLMAAGALAALGHAQLGFLLLAGVTATLLADLVWYRIGVKRGSFVLKVVSWLSPSPNGVARRAWTRFQQHGERILVWAKFVPNLSTFTTPLAGAAKMPLSRFLVYDGAGTLAWNGAFLGAGFVLGPEIESVAGRVPDLGAAPLLVLLAVLAGVALWRKLSPPAPEPVERRPLTGEFTRLATCTGEFSRPR